MFKNKSLIYHYIKEFSTETNAYKIFLSKKFRNHIHRVERKCMLPLFFFIFLAFISLLFVYDSYLQLLPLIVLLICAILIFCYRYCYFNPKAKKDIGYKKGSKSNFSDFFVWWYTLDLQQKHLKIIKKKYSHSKRASLLAAAKFEFEFLKDKSQIRHMEAITIALLAMMLSIILETDIISEWFITVNNNKNLTFEDKLYLSKVSIGLFLIILITYKYVTWNLLGYKNDKRKQLKKFIETLTLLETISNKNKENFKKKSTSQPL